MTDEVQAFIQAELQAFAVAYINDRRKFLQSRKINASQTLAQSLQFDLERQVRGEAISLLLAFEDSGRYIDMKQRPPEVGEFGTPYISLLEEWIRKRGWEDKFVAQFMQHRRYRTVPANVLNMIAWGIAVKRGKGKYRRRKWYNKSKSKQVSELFSSIIAGLPEVVTSEVVRHIPTR